MFFLIILCASPCLAQQSVDSTAWRAHWDYLDSLARQVHGSENLDSSFHYFSLMEEWADQQPSTRWYRLVLRRRADMLYRVDNFTLAIPDYRNLSPIYAEAEMFKDQSIVLRRLAVSLRKTGHFLEARDQYTLSIHAADLLGKEGKILKANSLNSLGNMYLNLEEFELARTNYQDALAIYEDQEHSEGIASCLNNLALIYSRTGQYAEAYPYLERSLELKIANNRPKGTANTYANLGDLAYEQADYAEAERYHLLSIQIRDSLGFKEDATQSYTRMGEIALIRENAQEAIQWCTKSCDIAEAGQFWEAKLACHRCLYEAYRQSGQFERSLVEYEIYQAIQDSTDKASNLQEAIFQEAKAQYEQQLAEAEQEKQALVDRDTQIRWTLVGLLILSTLISVYIYRSNRDAPSKEVKEKSTINPETLKQSEGEVDISKDIKIWLQELENSIEQMIESRQEITTGLLAQKNHLSERQLLRKIREQTGLTTQKFVQDVKLRLAYRWLEEKKYKQIKELSEALGFRSASYFSSLFQARFGKNPRDFF